MNKSELPAIGQPLQGGYFAGLSNSNGNTIAIIVAPKNLGTSEFAWGKYGEKIEGAGSHHDGQANTKALAESANEIGLWATGLNIEGHSDWYIPSRDELETIYRNLKPTAQNNYCSFRDGENPSAIDLKNRFAYTQESPTQTTAELFQTSEAFETVWHWSSTQSSAYYAWFQDFEGGYQRFDDKDNSYAVRAVRRELVI